MQKKISQEEFIRRVKEKQGDNFEILGNYVNRRTKVLTRCTKCGFEWEANPESMWTKKRGCPKCLKCLKKTTETFKKEVFELVGGEYEVIGEYVHTHEPILFRHRECGHEFMMEPNSFLRGQRCPNERYKKSAKSNSMPEDEMRKKVFDKGKGKYEVVGEYVRASKKTTFLHKECGNTFEMAPSRFINGGIRCPHCYKSKGEDIIEEYLIKNNFEFKKQYRIKECKNIRSLPFDFAIFDNNKLKCLIEYDGAQHFTKKFGMSEKEFLRTQTNDRIKNDFCKLNNITLIRIKYVRSDNPKIFKEKVINKLLEEFAKYNMVIPSQAYEETLRRCND